MQQPLPLLPLWTTPHVPSSRRQSPYHVKKRQSGEVRSGGGGVGVSGGCAYFQVEGSAALLHHDERLLHHQPRQQQARTQRRAVQHVEHVRPPVPHLCVPLDGHPRQRRLVVSNFQRWSLARAVETRRDETSILHRQLVHRFHDTTWHSSEGRVLERAHQRERERGAGRGGGTWLR